MDIDDEVRRMMDFAMSPTEQDDFIGGLNHEQRLKATQIIEPPKSEFSFVTGDDLKKLSFIKKSVDNKEHWSTWRK